MNNNCRIVLSPLTGEENIRIINQYKIKDIIDGWRKSFNIDIKDELHGIEEIVLYECNQTKLRFFYPPDATGSRAIYERLQQFDWYYMADKWEFDIASKNMYRFSNILEIGSAFGSFIKTALQAGLTIRGIELNEAAVRIARNQGLPVELSSIYAYANEYPESFDAVCSFQVLEHIPDPKSFIESSIKILKENGILIFSVPNSESFLKYQYNLLDMPPHHMTQWSAVAFRALENIFPTIKLEKVFYEPLAAYHVLGYLNAYAQYYKSVFRASKLVFNRYTLPILAKLLNFGNIKRFFRGQTILVQFRKL